VDDDAERTWLERAAGSDAAAWQAELGVEHDVTGLRAEANVLRYRPAPLTVRTVPGAAPVELLRVLLAAEATGTPVRVSLDATLSNAFKALHSRATRTGLKRLAAVVTRAETDAQFLADVRATGVARVRLVGEGPEADALADALWAPGLAVLTGPVLATGRRELLGMLREQAVSRTRHRFGHLPPDD